MKTTTINFLLTISLLAVTGLSSAQTYFQKIYQSSPYDQEGQDVRPTSDGGYLIVGYTTTTTVNDCDVQFTKTDAVGNKLFQKQYGGSKPDFIYHMLPTSDGNFFCAGYSQSYGAGDYDIFLMKVDQDANLIWSKTYGGSGNDMARDVIATSDGNYMIVGWSNSPSLGNQKANLIKIDPAGNVIWSKLYGGSSNDYGSNVQQCSDGGYIMLGITFSYGTNGDAYLVRLNSSGDTLWTKTYGGPQYDEGYYMVVNSDNSYTFLMRDSSNAGRDIDIRVIKTDPNGGVIWNKVYGGDQKDTPKMIQHTSDGGYIIASISRSFGWVNPDMWILKCNSSGDTTWTRHYGGSNHEHAYVAREQPDGSYYVVGKTNSYGPDVDIMFLKLDPQGTLAIGINELMAESGNIKLYPNPSEGNFNLDLKGMGAVRVTINNALGSVVYNKEFMREEELNIKLDHQPGLYVLKCESENGTAIKKFIIH